MSLYLWTGADAQTIRKVFQPVISQSEVPHKVIPFPEFKDQPLTIPQIGKGDVLLACGNRAIEAMQATGFFGDKKKRTIGSQREKAFPCHGGHVLFTYDPGMANIDYARVPEMQWDAQLAIRVHNTGSTECLAVKDCEYVWVESFHELVSEIDKRHAATGKPVYMSVDTETMGTDEYAPGVRILSVSFTIDEGKSFMMYFEQGEKPIQPLPWKNPDAYDYWEGVWEQINWLLTTDKVRIEGANLKYDCRWFQRHWNIACTNFKFDTLLVGTLLDENRSNSLKLHAKIMTPLGGYECVGLGTKVLKTDLTWANAEDFKVGDELIGFDEHSSGKYRRLRKATVLSTKLIEKPCIRIGLSNGKSIVCSRDHAFLTVTKSVSRGGWHTVDHLRIGTKIRSAVPIDDVDGSFEGGWMSGFLDGEGFVSKNSYGNSDGDAGFGLGWSQKAGAVHDRACDILNRAGVTGYGIASKHGGTNKDVLTAKMAQWDALRVLMRYRPIRLLAKEPWIGMAVFADGSPSVISLEDVGMQTVVAMKTSTATFIAEGLCSHNCGMDKYDMAHLEVVPKEELGQYMGGDTDATHRVAKVMRKELLADKQLVNFYTKLLHPSSLVFEKMERTGIVVDIDYYDRLETKLEAEQERLKAKMKALCPKKLIAKYCDNFSFSRPVIIKDLFFSPTGYNLKPRMMTEKSGEPSTAHDHLMMFADVPEAAEFVKLLAELNSANKTMSTYVRGFRKHLRSDGRFHPTFMLFKGDFNNEEDSGADTGRCLVGESLILTDKGEIPIKEVVERGEKGEQFKVLTHRNRWLPVTGFWRNGLKPVVQVRAAGRVLVSTYNHPYMSFPSWKKAEDLKTGSWLYTMVQPPSTEIWKEIPDWPFEVSNMGRVRRAIDGKGTKAGTIFKQQPKGKWGHLKVTLQRFINGREKQDFSVHKLVAHAFLGTPTGVEIAHLNGDAACNWVTNLKWVSIEENKLHQRLHGTYNRDSQKKVTWEIVDRIRGGEWVCDTDAAVALNVSRELVRDIRLGKKWVGRRDSMSGFMPIRVDKVTPGGDAETFDLTVDEDHSFVANGLVVHNTSCKEPAAQTVPKHTIWTKWLRRAFVAPPGYTILQLDFGQGELRIASCLANERTMIEAYLSGKDLHAVTGAKLAGYEFEDFMLLPEDVRDPFRSRAKAGNFGLLYGMGAEGFQAYAFSSYGVKMSLAEAEAARDAFFDLYPNLLTWHDEYKAHARRWGAIRSPLGRIRHLPLINSRDRQAASKAGRNAVNSPVQSCLSDMMQYAMVLMDREYPDLQFFLMTHDSVAVYVPIGEEAIWAKRLKSIMENLPLKKEFGWDHQLPFVADAEVAMEPAFDIEKEPALLELNDGVRSLASLKKLKVLA